MGADWKKETKLIYFFSSHGAPRGVQKLVVKSDRRNRWHCVRSAGGPAWGMTGGDRSSAPTHRASGTRPVEQKRRRELMRYTPGKESDLLQVLLSRILQQLHSCLVSVSAPGLSALDHSCIESPNLWGKHRAKKTMWKKANSLRCCRCWDLGADSNPPTTLTRAMKLEYVLRRHNDQPLKLLCSTSCK